MIDNPTSHEVDPLAPIRDALSALQAAWTGQDATGTAPATVESLGRSRLVAANDALGVLARAVNGLQAATAAEIARESRPELGPDALAKQQGFRNPVTLIAASTGTTMGEASRLVKVGQATAPRTSLTGEPMPAKHPYVAEGLKSASIGTQAASLIITMLDRAALRADAGALQQAEKTLVEQAAGLSLDLLKKVIARAEAYLDPDGIAPRERDARGDSGLKMWERDGMFHLELTCDVPSGAPLKLAIEAGVTADYRGAFGRGERAGDDPGPLGSEPDLRSHPQRQLDALLRLVAHAVGCDNNDLPLSGATVVVRMTLDDLQTGDGPALIDGMDTPISIAAARRMAAGGGVIPAVFDSRGELLDWGRQKRFFTNAQRLALVERDGGCSGCGAPPGMTRAHHLDWWVRDSGRTDLSKGVLLCESCHHRIHDNGWEIRIDGGTIAARVWFIPPPHVDPERTPRLGGRARYDYTAA
ncbi:HNH endonuclease signature motif containing protein [Microbacterium aureliae]